MCWKIHLSVTVHIHGSTNNLHVMEKIPYYVKSPINIITFHFLFISSRIIAIFKKQVK